MEMEIHTLAAAGPASPGLGITCQDNESITGRGGNLFFDCTGNFCGKTFALLQDANLGEESVA